MRHTLCVCWRHNADAQRSVSRCVAVCCSVLQCVAVCCSVMQCVAVLNIDDIREITFVRLTFVLIAILCV